MLAAFVFEVALQGSREHPMTEIPGVEPLANAALNSMQPIAC